MSGNTIRLSAPIHLVTAFAVGCAAAVGCGAAFASLMVARGLGLSAAGPLAGSFLGSWLLALLQKSRGLLWGGMLGILYAVTLLGLQLSNDSTPDTEQLVRLGLLVLMGALGGYAGMLCTGKKRHH